MSADSGGEIIRRATKAISGASPAKLPIVKHDRDRTVAQNGPMIVLDIDSGRRCYTRCELDLAEQDLPRVSGIQAESH